ncbi:hypothetical protein [Petrocella sp. FN5]|uniref:hypothetical protein n=1 Tax=Petrocella sp. FN5 TaxID=3032002 RepID=UPI0023DB7961|nr:hypothetical protein [Petrocella sp. FN5]MDF1616516.1 hypothetical protein [Petrocella sp. FN5]
MYEKLLNISYYVGFIPIYWLGNLISHSKRKKSHHYFQALAINFLLFCSFVIFLMSFGIHTFIIYYHRNLALAIPLEISFYILGCLLIICLIIWLEGIISAIIGHASRISLFPRWTRTKFLTVLTAFNHAFLILIIIVAIHASSIAQNEIEEAEIFLLYDDMGYIPRWVFALGFYRDSMVATNRFGNHSVAIVPLNNNTIDYALENGRFIFVSSHGVDGYILLQDNIFYGPANVKNNISPSLQYVYLSGCDTGLKHAEWENALSPAYVKTFDRLSTTLEHFYWLIAEGPEVIHSLN